MTVPACPVTAAQDALTLLRSRRAAMAMSILEGLPALIESALVRGGGVAYLRGQADAHRIIAAANDRRQAQREPAAAPPPAPQKPNRLGWLRDALADTARRERARVALRMDDLMLDRVVNGLATLSSAHWRRLREALV